MKTPHKIFSFIFLITFINIFAQTSFKGNSSLIGNSESFVNTRAPANTISFEKTFGGIGSDSGIGIDTTSDGGYAIVGYTSSFSGYEIMYLLKLDNTGSLKWSKTYDTFGFARLTGIKQTKQGDYYLSGLMSGGFGFYDDVIMKVDSVGNIIWAKNFGGIEADELRKLSLTPGEGIIVSGYDASFGAGAKDVRAIKFSSSGVVEWAKTYGTVYEDFNGSNLIASDGNYLFSGSFDLTGSYGIRPTIIKTDTSGNILWAKYYPGSFEDWGGDIVESPDGGYLMSGRTTSYGYRGSWDIYLIKTDSLGSVEWAKAYGSSGDESASSVIVTSDNEYLITGYTSSFGFGGYDAIIMKIDLNGSVEWFHTYGGNSNDYAYEVVETSDSGYAVTGRSSSNSLGGDDVFVFKTEQNGVSSCDYGTYEPNVTDIPELQAINLELATTSVVSVADLEVTTLSPNTEENEYCTVVPVELKLFNYNLEKDNVNLYWSTATEKNNMGFKILRDNEKIGFVAGSGTTTETKDYSFEDEKVNRGIHNYELIQIDYDGTSETIGKLVVNINRIPTEYALEQNYPNPFNPITKIQFTIPEANYVKLIVYNSLGERVAVLFEGMKDAGYYEAEFDGANLSSGIYFYSLLTRDNVQTKKMILFK